MPRIPAEAYVTLAPDWLCEVLSISTEPLDRGKKLRIYARKGVAHAWLVDPLAHTLEVMCLREGRWAQLGRYEGEARVRAVPFDAIELDLGALWIQRRSTRLLTARRPHTHTPPCAAALRASRGRRC